MSETVNTEVIQEELTEAQMMPNVNPFAEESWTTSLTPQVPSPNEASAIQKEILEQKNKATTDVPDETIMDPDEYLKENFGWATASEGTKELEELRKLKNGPSFSNDDSKKLYEAITTGNEDEIYSLLSKKRELSQLEQLKSEDIIRMNIRYSNPHYKSADIEDVFEEQYAKPSKPIQLDEEEDADYSVRVQKWQQQIEKIDRKIERDAFAAKEFLAKHKNELVLPDLPKQEQVLDTGIDPAVLEQFKQYKESVIKKLPEELNSFAGFNVMYKDKEVEIPITYTVADDEKPSLVQFVQEEILGEHFNVNDFFGKRWFDEKGMPTKTLYEDAYYFRNKDKVHQKFVNDAISKMQEHQLKVRSNINVNTQPQGTFNPQSQQSEFDKLASHFWANA